jgi:hypothetical protein
MVEIYSNIARGLSNFLYADCLTDFCASDKIDL